MIVTNDITRGAWLPLLGCTPRLIPHTKERIFPATKSALHTGDRARREDGKRGKQAKEPVILAVLKSGKPGDDLGMANRPRPLVKITRPSPSAGDRYELRDVDTDHVLASIGVTTLANPYQGAHIKEGNFGESVSRRAPAHATT